MPFKDPEQARKYNRDYQRARRAGSTGNNVFEFPTNIRIKTAEDVLSLLETTINVVWEAAADALVKGR